jgi:hypothetical protein
MDQGWRVEAFRPDRRKYRDITASWVMALVDAEPARREQVMAEAVQSAQRRPTLARRPY